MVNDAVSLPKSDGASGPVAVRVGLSPLCSSQVAWGGLGCGIVRKRRASSYGTWLEEKVNGGRVGRVCERVSWLLSKTCLQGEEALARRPGLASSH